MLKLSSLFIHFTLDFRMTEDIIYTLKRKNFSSNIISRVSDVFTENSFCDVTLVSDDQKPFQAHKFVLGTFSPVLKKFSSTISTSTH